MPALRVLQNLVNGGTVVVAIIILVGLIVSVAAWAIGSRGGNVAAADYGKGGVVVVLAAGLVLGLAPYLVNWFITAGQAAGGGPGLLSMGDLDREGLLSTRNLRIAAGILVALLLVAVGVVAGRSTAAGPAPAAASPHVAGWPDATRLVAAAPVGYAHSEAGAVDAATNYQLLLAGPLLTTPSKYRQAEQVIYAPAARERLMAGVEQTLAALQDQTQFLSNASKGVPVALIAVPISYQIQAYDGDHATVSLWWVWVVGQQGAMAPIEEWATSVLTLDWLGDWRIEDFDAASTPVPQPTQAASQSKDLPDQMHGYQEYGHVSG